MLAPPTIDHEIGLGEEDNDALVLLLVLAPRWFRGLKHVAFLA